MADRIRELVKLISETLPVQSRRRHDLFEELRVLKEELEASTPVEQLYALDAALLLMEFMDRSEDVATSETIQVVASLVGTIDGSRLGAPKSPAARHPLRKVGAAGTNVTEHADLRLTEGFLLGAILLKGGVISQETLARALQLQASSRQPLGQCLIQLGAATKDQIAGALSYQEQLRDGQRPRPEARPARTTLRLSQKNEEFLQSMNAQVLGEVLIRLGSITREQLAHALTVQRAASIHIGEAVVETGAATWDQVKKALEVQRQLRRYAA
jgi:hypothetical protein